MITILSISPSNEDFAALAPILDRSNCTSCTDARWRLETAPTIESGLSALRKSRIPIVLCEKDMLPVSWPAFLEGSETLPEPPFLIITSRLADELFWAEALARGAYDVIAKPFDGKEVVRVLNLAWTEWKNTHKSAPGRPKAQRAAASQGYEGGYPAVLTDLSHNAAPFTEDPQV